MKKKSNKTRRNLFIDIGLTLILLLALTRDLTGGVLHEWIGIALGVTIIVHLWLHRRWVVAISKRIFGPMPDRLRLAYLLNALLLVTFSLLFASGIMISETVMGLFGKAEMGGDNWSNLHELAKNGVIILVSTHIATHWKWILSTVRKNFGWFMPKNSLASKASLSKIISKNKGV